MTVNAPGTFAVTRGTSRQLIRPAATAIHLGNAMIVGLSLTASRFGWANGPVE